jgi:hypothetical protein
MRKQRHTAPAVGAAGLRRRTGLHRDVAVAGAVDHGLGADHQRPGLGLEYHALHSSAFSNRAAGEGVEQELHARLVEQIQRHQLEQFGIERHHVAGRERRRDGAADADQALEQLRQHASDHGLARAVIGGQQRGDAALLGHVALSVEGHERHDQRRGGVTAKKSVALGEDHARGVARAHRRAEAGGATANDSTSVSPES